MKAWLMDDFNGVEKLRLSEAPEPIPGVLHKDFSHRTIFFRSRGFARSAPTPTRRSLAAGPL